MNRTEIINNLSKNMMAAEQAIACVPADRWVIVWGASVLKTDGKKVSLIGPTIYSGSPSVMKIEAERFIAKTAGIDHPTAVRAMPARRALAAVRKANRELLASIPAF